MGLIFGGIGALIIATICAIIGVVYMRKLSAIEAAKPYTAQELLALHSRGGLQQACAIRGMVECDEPLQAPLSEKPCVIYRHEIIREGEEEYEVTDRNTGERRKEKRDVSDRLPDEDKRIPFWLHDNTGRVLVEPYGAELELPRETEHYEMSTGWNVGGNRTKGHRYTEYILPTGIEGHVIGWAEDREGRLVVGRHPSSTKQPFLVSNRSSEELAKRSGTLALVTLGAAIVLGFAGIALLVVGML